MNWKPIQTEEAINEIIKESFNKPVLIFKHSRTCSISAVSLNRWERNFKTQPIEELSLYFLDLLSYKNISNQISETFGVRHESPQILIISVGKCIFHKSHYEIDFHSIKTFLDGLKQNQQ